VQVRPELLKTNLKQTCSTYIQRSCTIIIVPSMWIDRKSAARQRRSGRFWRGLSLYSPTRETAPLLSTSGQAPPHTLENCAHWFLHVRYHSIWPMLNATILGFDCLWCLYAFFFRLTHFWSAFGRFFFGRLFSLSVLSGVFTVSVRFPVDQGLHPL
jgi:hypothetical protein